MLGKHKSQVVKAAPLIQSVTELKWLRARPTSDIPSAAPSDADGKSSFANAGDRMAACGCARSLGGSQDSDRVPPISSICVLPQASPFWNPASITVSDLDFSLRDTLHVPSGLSASSPCRTAASPGSPAMTTVRSACQGSAAALGFFLMFSPLFVHQGVWRPGFHQVQTAGELFQTSAPVPPV